MKRTLWLLVSLLLISSAAMADHIGIYRDATGTSCALGNIAGQFNFDATVIHKSTAGATGSRFKFTIPPATSFFAPISDYFNCGIAGCGDGFTFAYGGCKTGNIVIGTIDAIYGTGALQVIPAGDQVSIIYSDCSFVVKSATGGKAYVGTPGDCLEPPVATEASTWGSVKSLYR
jgi:hypothetical protein